MSVRRLFDALFAVALFAMAVVETLDPDMWWHLRTGEYILQHGLPRQDVFSFTVPAHAWITHEWLSQVFMWLVYEAGGFPLLIIVFAFLIALTFWFIYLVCDGRPYLAGFILLLAAIASAVVWGARPQIFNMLFTALFVFVVERYKRGQTNNRWLMWSLPIIMIIWANAHSGYLLGVVLLGTYTVGEGLQRQFGREADLDRILTWPQIKQLAVITAVCFLVAALNPSGPALWIYPFETLGSPAMQAYIQEWHSPSLHNTQFWPFAAMAGLGVLCMIFSPKRPSFSELLLYFGTVAAGFLSARHIPLFAIIGAPIVAHHATVWVAASKFSALVMQPSPHEMEKPARFFVIVNWVILLTVIFGALMWTAVTIDGNQEQVDARYPVAAVDFLQESGLEDVPIYNSYNWGGYLIWRGFPVFIDGRADVYGDDFIFYYRQTLDMANTWREPLDAYDVQLVMMERGDPLNTLLLTSNEWQEIYADDVAQILTRKDAE